MDCAYCPYIGRPDPRVIAELQAARDALFNIHATRRQLSVGQRRAIERGKSQQRNVFLVLLLVLAPLVLCGGGCGAFWVLMEGGIAPHDVPILIATLAPSFMVLLVGWLLMRWHRKGLERLMASCAAIPPAAHGRPAMCHVCGGPLPDAERNVVVRCQYCHADNVTSSDVVRAVAQKQVTVVNAMAGAVTNEAVQVAQNTSLAMTLSLVFALLSPVIALLVACGVFVVMVFIDVDPDPNERYAYTEVAGTRCYGSFSSIGSGYNLSFGKAFPELTDTVEIPPNELRTVRASELVGKEMLTPGDHPRKVRRLVRSMAAMNNYLDDGQAPNGLNPIGICEKPPNMSEVIDDPSLPNCAGVYVAGRTPYVVVADRRVFRVDIKSKQLALVSTFPGTGSLFFDGDQVLRHLSSGSVWSVKLSGSPVRATELLTEVDLFALSGRRLVMVSGLELKLQEEGGELRTLHTFKTRPQSIAASASHVFWSGEEGVMSLPTAGGSPTKIYERQYNPPKLTALGDYLMLQGSSCQWLRGSDGKAFACPYTGPLSSEYPSAPLADADHGYLIPDTTNRRDGVHGFRIADEPKFDRHYGPESTTVSCMGFDDEFVYWVEGSRLMRDLKAQK